MYKRIIRTFLLAIAITVFGFMGASPAQLVAKESIDITGSSPSQISDALNTALGQLSAGGVLYVTGNNTDEPGHIDLIIPSGVSVIWKAKSEGLSIGQNGGTLEVGAGGKIVVTGKDAISVESGNVIVSGGEVGVLREDVNDWEHRSAIRVNSGNVTVTGGNIFTFRNASTIYLNTGNVLVSGGTVTATGETVNTIPTNNCYAIRIDGAGTVAVTGGSVSAEGAFTVNCAVIIDEGLVAYYEGARPIGDFVVWFANAGIVVEVDSLTIPPSHHDTANGLTHIAGANLSRAKWDTSGQNPLIIYDEAYSVPWGELGGEPTVYPVRHKETGDLYLTISEAIGAINIQGINVYTLEVIGNVLETDHIYIDTEQITIVSANGSHTISSASSPVTAFTLRGGGTLILGDGSGTDVLTITYPVTVTNGSIHIREGVAIRYKSDALRLSGPDAVGLISGGYIESSNVAISLEKGAQISEISDGRFYGGVDAVHLSGKGTKIWLISGGYFYQTNADTALHGHVLFVQNESSIGVISGGYFQATRNCAIVVIRAGWIDEISGGDFVATRIGSYANEDRNGVVWIEGDNDVTGIGTISGGHFRGGYFGILLIERAAEARINSITGGLFEGVIAIQVDRGSVVDEISGGSLRANQGLMIVGVVGNITGDVEILGKSSSGIYIYLGGTIEEISGGKITSNTGNGIYNEGTINLISGGKITGARTAIYCAGSIKGDIKAITGGVFLGHSDVAIALAYPLQLEPGLSAQIGVGRFWGKDGIIFNDESLVNYPFNADAGEAYEMSTLTESVSGFTANEFKYLSLPEPSKPDSSDFLVDVVESYAENSGAGRYENGDEVRIDAGTRPGYDFVGWTTSDGVIFTDPSAAKTMFVMPAHDVTVVANWTKAEPPPSKPTTSTVTPTPSTSKTKPGVTIVPTIPITIIPPPTTVIVSTTPANTTIVITPSTQPPTIATTHVTTQVTTQAPPSTTLSTIQTRPTTIVTAPAASTTSVATAAPSTTSSAVPIVPVDPQSPGRQWALLNLLLCAIGILLALGTVIWALVRTPSNAMQARLIWVLLAIMMAAASAVVFYFTEDIRLPMGWVDIWTVVNALILGAEIVAIALVPKRDSRANRNRENVLVLRPQES